MKKILIFIFSLCLGYAAMAQDVILYDFNDSLQFEDWSVIDNPEEGVGGYNWRYDDEMGVVYSIVNLGNAPDFRIESPQFDVAELDITASFMFALGSYSSLGNARASISVYLIIDDMQYPRLQYNLVDSIGWVWYMDTIANLVDAGMLDLENNYTFRVAIEFNNVSSENALVMIDDFKLHKRDGVALLHFVGPEDGGVMDDPIVDTGEYFFAPAPEYDFPDGTVFLYWHVEDMGDNVYHLDEGDSVWVSGDMIWYAQWGAEYTVSYDINDGSGYSPDVEDAIQYLGHEVLDWGYTRDHYIFSGYNTEADGSGTHYDIGDTLDLEIDFSGAIITTDVWLYAEWTPITVKIHYDANGGMGIMSGTVILEDSDYEIEECLFYRTGFGFDHWNTEPDDSGIDYYVGETFNTDEDFTFYAQWVPVPTITVSFDLGGAASTLPDTVVNADYDFIIPDYQVAYFGYALTGWEDTENDTIYRVGDTIRTEVDLTLTAVWEALPMVSISFSADAIDALGAMSNAVFPAADSYTVPASAFTRRGYTFSGWYEQSADTLYYEGDVISLTEGEYLFNARWTALPKVTITFNANNSNATGVMNDMETYRDSLFILPECLYTYEGFYFSGWNTKADGTGTAIADGGMISFATDTTLYAQWEEIIVIYHAISFNANGGEGSMASIEVEDSRVMTMPACAFTREGYSFVGWCVSPDGAGDTLAVGDDFYVGQEYTFYAIWKSNETEAIAIASMGGMTVGPNPATTTINVGGVDVVRLTIIDIYGHMLRTVESQSAISLASLPSGIYTLRIETADGIALKRIVKK